MQVRNAMPRGWRTDNRLIDCTLIDAGPQGTWKEERLQGRLAEEEQPLHAVSDRVPTISLRTNERASDLSRKIYSFIHPKRRLCSLVDPSGFPLSRRSTHTRRAQSRKRDPDHRPGLSPFPCVAVSTRFDVHKHSTISNEISEIRLGQLSTILNRDLPECMRTRPRYRLRSRSLPVSKRSKRKLGGEDLRGILISGHVVGIGVERGVR